MKYTLGLITSHISEKLLDQQERRQVETPWGAAPVYCGLLAGTPCAVILRYGEGSAKASHRINFRANIWALRTLGVETLIMQNAIGSVNPDIRPGDFVIPDDILDFTKNRELSFFQDEDCWLRVDMTDPFCPVLREKVIQAAKEAGETPWERGIFVCTEGPRFESPAEVRFYRSAGGDIIGTPMIPELILAKEASMCCASISIVINMASGLAPAVVHGGQEGIVHYYCAAGLEERLEAVLRRLVKKLDGVRNCGCKNAMTQGIHGQAPDWAIGVLLPAGPQ